MTTQSHTADIPGETPVAAPDAPVAEAEVSAEAPAEVAAEAVSAVPEKFQNPDGSLNSEALLESYRNLESKQGETPAAPEAPEAPATPEDIARQVPLSEALGSFAEEYAKDGTLSDGTYTKLEKEYNVDRAAVDRYIQGEQAIAEQATREIFDIAGGKEEYQKVLAWVHKNEGEDATNALTERLGTMIGSADRDGIRREMQGVLARYKEGTRTGWAPSITGRDAAGNSIQPFSSEREMQQAQQDPAYRDGDSAAHKVFDERLRLSLNMGTIK